MMNNERLHILLLAISKTLLMWNVSPACRENFIASDLASPDYCLFLSMQLRVYIALMHVPERG